MFGLSRLGEARNGAALGVALGALVVGVAALTVFIRRQLVLQGQERPFLDLRAFRFDVYRRSVLLLCIAMMALFGMVILLPIYLQSIRGLGSLQTGLLLLPGGLTMGLLATPVGRLFDRYGPRWLTTGGAVLMTAAMLLLATVQPTTPVWLLVGAHLLLSVGLAGIFTPTFTAGLNPLPPHLYSHGSAILTTLQQVAGAAGVALLVTIMAGRSGALLARGASDGGALLGGLHAAFLVAAATSAVAIGLALTLQPPRDAGPAAAEEAPAATSAQA